MKNTYQFASVSDKVLTGLIKETKIQVVCSKPLTDALIFQADCMDRISQ